LASPDFLAATAAAQGRLGDIQRYHEEHAAAQASYKRLLELQIRAYQLEPSNPVRLAGVASAYRGLGFGELDSGNPTGAAEQFKKGSQILEQGLARDPKNASPREALMRLIGDTGNATLDLGA
jgi:hypothetical protein